ncbi:MAG TPA: magnesium transporter CorA family protein [Steroidobacteraceae bacterium]|nr:magnesium transporter CorA family protein [Steroidobacteraceae bacterium]
MLNVFVAGGQGLQRIERGPGDPLPTAAVWLDLIEPSREEEELVERTLGIDVPTREEMREIEASNRLYEENGALYLTATIVTHLETDAPETQQVTFIVKGSKLVTNRYVDPLPFRRFIAYAERHPAICSSPWMLLAGLLEFIINRVADVLERVGADLDATTSGVFAPRAKRRGATRDFRAVLQRVAQNGELISKARESLVSLGRMLAFVQQAALASGGNSSQPSQEVRARFRTVSRDVLAMSDHASFLGTKVQFILDATLGMVTINQNDILKIFSVVTVFLLPPTVIASFYGMNFERIPWLQEEWGPWVALGLMVASSLMPYLIFKRRGWL